MHLSKGMECNLILGTLSIFTDNQDYNTFSESHSLVDICSSMSSGKKLHQTGLSVKRPMASRNMTQILGDEFLRWLWLDRKVLDIDRWNWVSSLPHLSRETLSKPLIAPWVLFYKTLAITSFEVYIINWTIYMTMKHWFTIKHHMNAQHYFSQIMTYG